MADKTITDIIGSSISQFARDPITGKVRTTEEIIKAALQAGLANVSSSQWGTSYDETTGTINPWNEAQKADAILAQLAANAKREAPNLAYASGVSSALGNFGNQQGNVTYFLQNDPTKWAVDKSKIGSIIKRGQPGLESSFIVLDPNQKTVSSEQLKQVYGERANFIDPVTGYIVDVDLQSGKINWNAPSFNSVDENGNIIPGSGSSGSAGGSGGYSPLKTAEQIAAETKAAENKAARQSAYDLLLNEFNKYGLGTLVEGIKGMIQENVSPSEFSIRLQNTDAYKQRFAANQDRIKQGLRALTPAEYIGLEDQYQNIMRNYGLPASYYSKDSMGTQAGFNKFIANDVSAAELEDRIATAQKRVINADVNVTNALKQFYPDITNADILAYTLDPTNALENIKRKVTAAEIGGAALAQNLATGVGRAEELAKYGVTKAQAQQGYSTIGEFLPTAEKLGDIYAKQGMGAYNQQTAESEVFNTADAAEAARKRKKLTQLEQATFGGSSGTSQGALARERAGNF